MNIHNDRYEDAAIARFCSNEGNSNAKLPQTILITEISKENNIDLHRILRFITRQLQSPVTVNDRSR